VYCERNLHEEKKGVGGFVQVVFKQNFC